MWPGRLPQWKNALFIKFSLVRPWFKFCHMPSLFLVQLMHKNARPRGFEISTSEFCNLAIRIKNYCSRTR